MRHNPWAAQLRCVGARAVSPPAAPDDTHWVRTRRDSAPDGFADGVSAQRGEPGSPVLKLFSARHPWRNACILPTPSPAFLAGRSRSCEVTLSHFGLRSPVTERALEFVHHQAITIDRQPLVRHWPPRHVTAQPLEFVRLSRATGHRRSAPSVWSDTRGSSTMIFAPRARAALIWL